MMGSSAGATEVNVSCTDSSERHHDDPQRYDHPLRAGGIQQLAPRHLTEQAGESTCAQNEADLLLRPFLIGQINGHIWTEACQHPAKEEIDSVKTVETRRGRRELCGGGVRARHRRSSCKFHEAGFAPCPRCWAGPTSCKLRAVPIKARCENACGKLPSCRRA